MVHAFLYIFFSFGFAAYLKPSFDDAIDILLHWKWVLAAFVTGVVGDLLAQELTNPADNFLLHASGGFAAVLIYIYLTKTLKIKLPIRLLPVTVFGFVSMLGVANELTEYALELGGYDTFSFDLHDTWRDLVANTLGGGAAFVLFFKHLRKN